MATMLPQLFASYGRLVSSRPWISITTFSALVIGVCKLAPEAAFFAACPQQGSISDLQLLILTVTRCSAIIYAYRQLVILGRSGSKLLMGIVGIYYLLSNLMFVLVLVTITQGQLHDINSGMPLFVILSFLSSPKVLAKAMITSPSKEQLITKLGAALAELGPEFILNTVLTASLVSFGTISVVPAIRELSAFVLLSVIVSYFCFMTFYPACLVIWFNMGYNLREHQPGVHLSEAFMNEGNIESGLDSRHPSLVTKASIASWLLSIFLAVRWQLSTNPRLLCALPDPTPSSLLFYQHWPELILCVVLTLKFVFENDGEMIEDAFEEKVIEKEKLEALHSRRANARAPTNSRETTGAVELKKALMDLEYGPTREMSILLEFLKSSPESLRDREVINLVQDKHIPAYNLETVLKDPERGVRVRRLLMLENQQNGCISRLPYKNYDYSLVSGACCENVVGFLQVPVGIAGPLLLDGKRYSVPMATTEGCLVASTNRGCRALASGEGVKSCLLSEGMTRAPVVKFPSAMRASQVYHWLEEKNNYEVIKSAFDSTSRFARLKRLQVRIAARYLYIRLVATTGDAMGMNMISKGSEKAMDTLRDIFPDMDLIGLSSNLCTDKKPSAVNWIEGRGKSVVAEAIISGKVVREVLKTDVESIVELNISKNLVGSAMAGSIGGFNAHAANIVTAVYLATGQDPAQNVGSSNCITILEPCGPTGEDLYISCSMPSMEVGTVGGGTGLPAQGACLELLGVRGACIEHPGENARQLARIICGAVLAGELSLLSASSAGHMVRAHLQHNRAAAKVA